MTFMVNCNLHFRTSLTVSKCIDFCLYTPRGIELKLDAQIFIYLILIKLLIVRRPKRGGLLLLKNDVTSYQPSCARPDKAQFN